MKTCKPRCEICNAYFIILAVTLIICTLALTSCASSNYYKGCDGKKKFRTQMQY